MYLLCILDDAFRGYILLHPRTELPYEGTRPYVKFVCLVVSQVFIINECMFTHTTTHPDIFSLSINSPMAVHSNPK